MKQHIKIIYVFPLICSVILSAPSLGSDLETERAFKRAKGGEKLKRLTAQDRSNGEQDLFEAVREEIREMEGIEAERQARKKRELSTGRNAERRQAFEQSKASQPELDFKQKKIELSKRRHSQEIEIECSPMPEYIQSLFTKKDIPQKTHIRNPIFQNSVFTATTEREYLLINSRTNSPLFLDPHSKHGLKIDIIHERGAIIRNKPDGGEDFSSYLATAQRLIFLLPPMRKEIATIEFFHSTRGYDERDDLAGKQRKVDDFSRVLKIGLIQVSKATGVPLDKLQYVPGIENTD